jgi:DNA-binding GntR family transcriptional regulator
MPSWCSYRPILDRVSVPDSSNPRPFYLQIADDLRNQVAAGRLQVGERLPARRQLAQQYGVAVETIRRALDELTREGLVSTQSTRGTYVIELSPMRASSLEHETAITELRELAERMKNVESRLKDLEARWRLYTDGL